MARLLTNQLLTRAQQVAHLLRLCVRHEARPDQTVPQQFGQPHRIVDVGLAARHVLHMRGVCQHQSHTKATPKPHQSHTKATPKPHQGHTKATPKPTARPPTTPPRTFHSPLTLLSLFRARPTTCHPWAGTPSHRRLADYLQAICTGIAPCLTPDRVLACSQ